MHTKDIDLGLGTVTKPPNDQILYVGNWIKCKVIGGFDPRSGCTQFRDETPRQPSAVSLLLSSYIVCLRGQIGALPLTQLSLLLSD